MKKPRKLTNERFVYATLISFSHTVVIKCSDSVWCRCDKCLKKRQKVDEEMVKTNITVLKATSSVRHGNLLNISHQSARHGSTA